MTINFDSIADQTMENVKRPPLPPLGTYIWQVIKVPGAQGADVSSPKGNWKAYEFTIRGVRPTEDVDMEALREYGSISNAISRVTFMFDKDKADDQAAFDTVMFRLMTFLNDHLGLPKVDEDGRGIPLKVLLNNALNKQFMANMTYRTADNGDQFIQIGKTAPVEV